MSLNQVTVTVENAAPDAGTNLTPVWVGFHDGRFDTYDRDQQASPGLERLAEDGNNAVISQEFADSGFGDIDGTIGNAPIANGSVLRQTFNIDDSQGRFFNYASMVLPSNDTFIANGNPLVHEIFDEFGNFVGADILVSGSQALDAGTEVNDEIPANTAFFGQTAPDTGVPENGTVQLSSGFNPVGSGGILDDPRFANADFTAPDYQIARIRVSSNPLARLSSLLSADQEVQGGGDPDASGTSELLLNEFGDALSYSLTVSGLDFGQFIGDGAPQTEDTSDDVTRIHLHSAPRGENGDVAFGLIDLVLPAADGQDNDDLQITQNADGSVTLQGIWELTDPALISLSEFVDSIQNAESGADIPLYWNVHTTGSPGGAIRGQLQDDSGVAQVVNGRQTETITLGSEDSLAVNRRGRLNVDGTAVEVEARAQNVRIDVNRGGVIDGSFNGVNFANGGESRGILTNRGLITSESRAVNLGGRFNRVDNSGRIVTTANPRDGVVYSDQTAQAFTIENRSGGLIDVGRGNQGDAISLELNANVTGEIVNAGHVQGRGAVSSITNSQSSAIRLYWGNQTGASRSVFNGNIENSGQLASEQGATVLIEDQTELNGEINNSGRIQGGSYDGGRLAIDSRDAEGSLVVNNTGRINGDVLLTAGDDTYEGSHGRIRGTVFGGDGSDRLLGGNRNETLIGGSGDDILNGGRGRNVLEGGTGSDTLIGGKGRNIFVFGSDLLQDSVADIDTVLEFGRSDQLDFSQYLGAGGSITAFQVTNGEQGSLLSVELSSGDSLTISGNVLAALNQVARLA